MPNYMDISWLSEILMDIHEDNTTVDPLMPGDSWVLRGSDHLMNEMAKSYNNEDAIYN